MGQEEVTQVARRQLWVCHERLAVAHSPGGLQSTGTMPGVFHGGAEALVSTLQPPGREHLLAPPAAQHEG